MPEHLPERVNDETARILLLQMIRDLLDLNMDERLNENPDALELQTTQFEQFGKDLGRTPAEASRMYTRLVREGFISTFRNEEPLVGRDGVVQYAWVLDLTDEGDKLLGVLANPRAELLEGLNAILEAIQALDSDVTPFSVPDPMRV